MEIEDQVLLAQFGTEATRHYAFNQLVLKYQQRIYYYIRKMVIDHDDADDITQDVFVKVWHNLPSFRQDANFYTWLYRIATNECLNFLGKKRRRFMLPIHDVESELLEKLHASDTIITGDDITLRLQEALLKLPEKQRLVFNMKYFEDLTYEEISAILGTSVGGLKASYHHATKKIEAFLGAQQF